MRRLLPRRVLPVLMYHRLGSPGPEDSDLWLSEEAFGRQLGWLRKKGFRTLSLADARALFARRQVPRRTLLLTFDDAFAETLERASAILAHFNMQAAVFVPAGLLGQEIELRHPQGQGVTRGRIASEEELRRWSASGLEVGSHSLTHLSLPGRSAEEIRDEVAGSRRHLEQVASRPVLDFCYPYGLHDAISRREVAAAGYRAAYAGEPPTDDLFALPRMMIYPHDSPGRFRRKVSGNYYWISAWHRLLRGLAPRGDKRES